MLLPFNDILWLTVWNALFMYNRALIAGSEILIALRNWDILLCHVTITLGFEIKISTAICQIGVQYLVDKKIRVKGLKFHKSAIFAFFELAPFSINLIYIVYYYDLQKCYAH